MNNAKYFSITYDMSKLSDDEQKAVIAEAVSAFSSQKAVSAGWEITADVERDSWININREPPLYENIAIYIDDDIVVNELGLSDRISIAQRCVDDNGESYYSSVEKQGDFCDICYPIEISPSQINGWQPLPKFPRG